MNSNNYHYFNYFQTINENAKEIVNFIDGMDIELFLQDKKTQKAVARNLQIIGTYGLRTLEEYPQVRRIYSDFPWTKWIREWILCNKMSELSDIDNEVAWEVITETFLPGMIDLIDSVEQPADFIPLDQQSAPQYNS